MKRMLTTAFAISAAAIAGGADSLEKDLWFFADFDSAARMDGLSVDLCVDPADVCEGRYGKAAYFHRRVKNVLPPMAEFLGTKTNYTISAGATCAYDAASRRLRLSGGEVAFRPVEDPLGYEWVRPTGAATYSFYVKGAKGTVVTLTPSITPTVEKNVKEAARKRKFDPAKQVPDEIVASTNVLDGTWRRVYAAVRHDVRTTAGRAIALKVAATGPVEMERFQLERSAVFPFLGNLKPALWTEGGTARKSGERLLSDPALVKNFPVDAGTASFWVRSIAGDEVWDGCRAWAYLESPKCEFSFDGDFRPGSWHNRIIFPKAARLDRSEQWQHVAMTWSASNYNFYVDGKLRHHCDRGYKVGERGGRREFRLGTATNGTQPGDIILDEVAVFRRSLSADEIAALAARTRGLLADNVSLLAGPVNFPFFWRNQPDAALRMPVNASAPGEWTLVGEVGGKPLARKTIRFETGENKFAAAFDPARFRPGKYPWHLALVGKDGREALVREGTLEIRGRLDRAAPTYMSWGGNKPVSNGFMKLTGLDSKIVDTGNLPAVREVVADGIVPNIRHGNAMDWERFDFDYGAVEREAERRLSPYEGLFSWSSTLVNTEVYGTWSADKARLHPKFMEIAEKAIGMKPDFTFGHAPSQVSWGKLGMKPPRGILGPTNATFETLTWYIDRGQPVYGVNAATRRAVRRLSPGNVVWTEPVYGQGGISEDVDLMADWFYSYEVADNLMGQRRSEGALRGRDKPFMPTLSMYTGAPGRHPTRLDKDGKPERVTMGQSYDELAVKTHVAIAATRADRLSMFSADSWEFGLKDYAKWTESPTNKVSVICDPDAPARYGKLVRARIMPEIELLRGMKNVRSPIAVLEPGEPDVAGGHGWTHWHFVRAMRKAIGREAVPYDIVGDREMNDANVLAQYRCLVFPMGSVVTERHHAALAEAARRGSTVVLDQYATNDYPHCVKVASRYYGSPGRLPETAGEPLLGWYTNHIEELRALLPSASSCDYGENGYTFEKRYGGVRYVTVVNNKRKERSEGGGVLLTFCTNSWYRPYCAPQRITTTLRGVPQGVAIYEFNAEGKDRKDERDGKDVRITRDFEAAEGVVYCVYPEPLKAPELSVSRLSSSVLNLGVKILTKSGKPAPGRTIVRVMVTDPDGRVTDESGRYAVENGKVEIPIRFADGDPEGGLFSKWKAVVTDLMTGEESTIRFTR